MFHHSFVDCLFHSINRSDRSDRSDAFDCPDRVARSFKDSNFTWASCSPRTHATDWREVGGLESQWQELACDEFISCGIRENMI